MPQGKLKWKGFVKCNLTALDKQALTVIFNEVDVTNLLDDIAHIVSEGFAFSLKPPTEKTQSFAASFRGIDPESDNAGWMLTGWGADGIAAMVTLVYKHNEILRGDYSGGGVDDDPSQGMFG